MKQITGNLQENFILVSSASVLNQCFAIKQHTVNLT